MAHAIQAWIQYTREAPPGSRNGVFVGKTSAFALNSTTFAEQHGFVPYPGPEPSRLYNELVWVPTTIVNARSDKRDFKLIKDGFELVRASLGPANDLRAYMTRLEEVVLAASGANYARAFSHTARNWSPPGSEVQAMGYGMYAHTDVGTASWATSLTSLGSDELPPGLVVADATRAIRGKRYAIVTAWRYLGPDAHCTKSHLAVLDHSTLRPDDVLDFELHAQGTFGANYRLKHVPNDASRHCFYYYPRMSVDDEVLLFIAYDSEKRDFFKTPVPTTFHSAFVDPHVGDAPNDRQSIDVRLLIVWD